ncbi:MAG: metallophosphoesterase [Verrucomicrobiota bacterium]
MQRILITGDIHGQWLDFRDEVNRTHKKDWPLDLAILCGDSQALRTEHDLEYLHCPAKYRKTGEFPEFYRGNEHFPVPVLLVGGNHEGWNFLDEYRDGGQLAPGIDFIGRVGLREIDGLRIVGVSGVYSPKRFDSPHPAVPYGPSQKRLATYYNREDIEKALSYGSADILILHEWPDLMNAARDPTWPERWREVGSSELSRLIRELKPKCCFCGHMHLAAELFHEDTRIVCLSAFDKDFKNSIVIMEPEDYWIVWPRKLLDQIYTPVRSELANDSSHIEPILEHMQRAIDKGRQFDELTVRRLARYLMDIGYYPYEEVVKHNSPDVTSMVFGLGVRWPEVIRSDEKKK